MEQCLKKYASSYPEPDYANGSKKKTRKKKIAKRWDRGNGKRITSHHLSVHTGEIQNGVEVKRVKWEDLGVRIPVCIMGWEQGISVSWAV